MRMPLITMFILLTSLSNVQAKENFFDIKDQHDKKEQQVTFLKNQINKHEKMNFDEILNDIKASAHKNRKLVKADDLQKFDLVVEQSLQDLENLSDKDLVLAFEKVELQNYMSSINYVFWYSRYTVTRCTQLSKNHTSCEARSSYEDQFIPLWLMLTIPLDTVTLPITLFLSLMTGF